MMCVLVSLLLVFISFMSCGLLTLGIKEDANMTVTGSCIEKERKALLDVKANLLNKQKGEWWNEEENMDCCKWVGVNCSNSGHVIELDLSTSFPTLAGKISPPLQLLHQLQYLNLSGIDFQSNPVPNFLGSLSNLQRLDISGANLSGPIPPQLANLSNLLLLNLSRNFFNGSIPFSFGDLASLTHLDLSRNQLGGVIPKSFENCSSSLVILNLSENKLDGLLPNLSGCSALEELILHGNALHGGVPNITGWSSLFTLSLAHNSLNGRIPDFTGCKSLQKIDLSSNQLSGDLPKSVGELSNLEYLDTSSNPLNGVVSDLLFLNLSKLYYLDFSFNSFAFKLNSNVKFPFQLRTLKLKSCNLGPSFPKWIQSQRNFTNFDISNSGISDIPAWFLDLPQGLKFLNLSSNEINGMLTHINQDFNGYPGMDLSNNHLEGKVGLLPSKLAALNLSGNRFSGNISFLCQIDANLTYLDLSNNLFSGSLPDCWSKFQNNLVVLNLSNNTLSGEIPSSLGLLSKLEALYLRKNAFFGHLPLSLSNCTMLMFADLGENKLSGVIPEWIGGNLSKLYVLVLGTNKFYGRLPSQVCWLHNLQLLDLSNNEFSGHIPWCFGNFTAMASKTLEDDMTNHSYSYGGGYHKSVPGRYSSSSKHKSNTRRLHYQEKSARLSYSSLNPETPACGNNCIGPIGYWLEDPEKAIFTDHALVAWKGTKRMFGRTGLELLRSIDLSRNNFSGNLPNEIMNLIGLVSLNFSTNKLHGEVPKDIGRLMSLESLDLSRNEFSGKIPSSLSQISYLSYLDLSYNNFFGRIPDGTQLQRVDSSFYRGNPLLCGPPLIQACGHPPSAAIVIGKEDVEDDFWKSYYTGMGSGFAVGFLGICGILFVSSHCRYILFASFNHTKDWIYVTVAVNFQRLQRKYTRLL